MLVDKYQLPLEEENGKVYIDFKQFMEIMTENIIRNRERFGTSRNLTEVNKFIKSIRRNSFYIGTSESNSE